MKRRLASLLAVFLFLFSVPLIAGAVDQSAKAQKEAAQNENPYVQKYLEERGTVADESSLFNNSEQRTSDMETLVEIYREDTEVGDILQKYSMSAFSGASVDYAEKATSLDREQIVQVMHNIERVYPAASEDEQELMLSYLLHHAEACEDPQATAFLKSLNNTDPIQLMANYSYNSTAGVNYALNWWHRFNTDSYPALDALPKSGDCTNFVSQCLKAGGVPFQSNWYCYKKNSTYPHPTTREQLNYSWNLADPSPWITIKAFGNYWYSRVTVKSYTLQQYKDHHADAFVSKIGKGDIVLFKSSALGVSWPVHAMIISDYDGANKDFLCAGHTNARNYYPLLTALNSGGYSGVDFYLF